MLLMIKTLHHLELVYTIYSLDVSEEPKDPPFRLLFWVLGRLERGVPGVRLWSLDSIRQPLELGLPDHEAWIRDADLVHIYEVV